MVVREQPRGGEAWHRRLRSLDHVICREANQADLEGARGCGGSGEGVAALCYVLCAGEGAALSAGYAGVKWVGPIFHSRCISQHEVDEWDQPPYDMPLQLIGVWL